MFTSFKKNDCPSDCNTFGDNSQGKVLEFSKITITTEYPISKFLLVELLDYNLLTLSCKVYQNQTYLTSRPDMSDQLFPTTTKSFLLDLSGWVTRF
jgi:hypothetical protein